MSAANARPRRRSQAGRLTSSMKSINGYGYAVGGFSSFLPPAFLREKPAKNKDIARAKGGVSSSFSSLRSLLLIHCTARFG